MILIMGALLTTSACLLCALVVDLGHLAASRAELQRASDAAALASAAMLVDEGEPIGQPNPALVASQAREVASLYTQLNPARDTGLILDTNDHNSPDGDLVLGRYTPHTGTFDPHSTQYNAIHLVLRRDTILNGPVRLFFGGFIGRPSVNIQSVSRAYIEKDILGFRIPTGSLPGTTCELLPFSLHVDEWEKLKEKGSHSLFPSRLAPGNFGTVNIRHYDGQPLGNSASVMRDHILNGPDEQALSTFPENTLTLPFDLNGDTGVTASMRHELNEIIDNGNNERIIFLHKEVQGTGNTAVFTIIAFAAVRVTEIRLTGALRNRYIHIEPCTTNCSTAIGGGQDGDTSHGIVGPTRLIRVN